MTDFINKNNILIIKITEIHVQEVFRKFFSWNPPFNTTETLGEFHNRDRRDARKKHIPDAFIIEAILSFLNQGDDVRVISRDDQFKKSLPPTMKDKIYKTIGEALKSLESPEEISPQVSLQPPSTSRGLDFLSSELEEDRRVMLRTLGYTYWFSKPNPLIKEELYQRVQGQGHHHDIIKNVAQRLVLSKALKDIGKYYLPLDVSLCKQAASEIMPEILELLDQG